MLKKTWRVAVVGCGSFENGVYLPNIEKEAPAKCVAVCDIIPERAKETAERFGVPQWYPSVYEMIKKCDLILR